MRVSVCCGLAGATMLLGWSTSGVHSSCATPPPVSGASEVKEASVSHLPAAIRQDIEAWRERLENAVCLKVVADTEEVWESLYELDADGSPKVLHRERFSVHSWMTRDSLWLVIYAMNGDRPDTSAPLVQLSWSADQHRAWERLRTGDGAYRDRVFETTDEAGPENINFGAKGCVFATVTTSWLAGPKSLESRSISVRSVALMRRPQLPIVPANPRAHGYWLDVFRDAPRNEDPTGSSLYRRSDHMLLGRDGDGRPELREWRTIVTSDESGPGESAQRITGIRRFTYTFFDRVPAELSAAAGKFRAEVETTVEVPKDK